MKNLIYVLAFIAGVILGFLLCRKGCGEPQSMLPPFVEGVRPIPQMVIAFPDGLKIIPVDTATKSKYDAARITVIHNNGVIRDTITNLLVVNKAQINASEQITIPIKAWDASVYDIVIEYLSNGKVVDYVHNRIADTIGWETVDVGITSNKDTTPCLLECTPIYTGKGSTHAKVFPALGSNCYLKIQIGADIQLFSLSGHNLNYLLNCNKSGNSLVVQNNSLVAMGSNNTQLYSISMSRTDATNMMNELYQIAITCNADSFQNISMMSCCTK